MQRFIAVMVVVTTTVVIYAVIDQSLLPWDWPWTTPAMIGLAAMIVIPGIAFGARWVGDDGNDRPSPHSLYLTREGRVVLILFSLATLAAPALIMWEWWLAVVLAFTVLFGATAWVVAGRTGPDAYWHGLVVFISVPLLGAVAGIVRNAADPQFQPVAMVLEDGRQFEAIELAVAGGRRHDRDPVRRRFRRPPARAPDQDRGRARSAGAHEGGREGPHRRHGQCLGRRPRAGSVEGEGDPTRRAA